MSIDVNYSEVRSTIDEPSRASREKIARPIVDWTAVVDTAADRLAKGKKPVINAGTGTGKTTVATRLLLKKFKTLVLFQREIPHVREAANSIMKTCIAAGEAVPPINLRYGGSWYSFKNGTITELNRAPNGNSLIIATAASWQTVPSDCLQVLDEAHLYFTDSENLHGRNIAARRDVIFMSATFCPQTLGLQPNQVVTLDVGARAPAPFVYVKKEKLTSDALAEYAKLAGDDKIAIVYGSLKELADASDLLRSAGRKVCRVDATGRVDTHAQFYLSTTALLTSVTIPDLDQIWIASYPSGVTRKGNYSRSILANSVIPLPMLIQAGGRVNRGTTTGHVYVFGTTARQIFNETERSDVDEAVPRIYAFEVLSYVARTGRTPASLNNAKLNTGVEELATLYGIRTPDDIKRVAANPKLAAAREVTRHPGYRKVENDLRNPDFANDRRSKPKEIDTTPRFREDARFDEKVRNALPLNEKELRDNPYWSIAHFGKYRLTKNGEYVPVSVAPWLTIGNDLSGYIGAAVPLRPCNGPMFTHPYADLDTKSEAASYVPSAKLMEIYANFKLTMFPFVLDGIYTQTALEFIAERQSRGRNTIADEQIYALVNTKWETRLHSVSRLREEVNAIMLTKSRPAPPLGDAISNNSGELVTILASPSSISVLEYMECLLDGRMRFADESKLDESSLQAVLMIRYALGTYRGPITPIRVFLAPESIAERLRQMYNAYGVTAGIARPQVCKKTCKNEADRFFASPKNGLPAACDGQYTHVCCGRESEDPTYTSFNTGTFAWRTTATSTENCEPDFGSKTENPKNEAATPLSEADPNETAHFPNLAIESRDVAREEAILLLAAHARLSPDAVTSDPKYCPFCRTRVTNVTNHLAAHGLLSTFPDVRDFTYFTSELRRLTAPMAPPPLLALYKQEREEYTNAYAIACKSDDGPNRVAQVPVILEHKFANVMSYDLTANYLLNLQELCDREGLEPALRNVIHHFPWDNSAKLDASQAAIALVPHKVANTKNSKFYETLAKVFNCPGVLKMNATPAMTDHLRRYPFMVLAHSLLVSSTGECNYHISGMTAKPVIRGPDFASVRRVDIPAWSDTTRYDSGFTGTHGRAPYGADFDPENKPPQHTPSECSTVRPDPLGRPLFALKRREGSLFGDALQDAPPTPENNTKANEVTTAAREDTTRSAPAETAPPPVKEHAPEANIVNQPNAPQAQVTGDPAPSGTANHRDVPLNVNPAEAAVDPLPQEPDGKTAPETPPSALAAN